VDGERAGDEPEGEALHEVAIRRLGDGALPQAAALLEQALAPERLGGCNPSSQQLGDRASPVARGDPARQGAAQIGGAAWLLCGAALRRQETLERVDLRILERDRDPGTVAGAEAILKAMRRLGIAEARRATPSRSCRPRRWRPPGRDN